jgi:hypothetical protein
VDIKKLVAFALSLCSLTACDSRYSVTEMENIRQKILDQARTNLPSFKEVSSLYPRVKIEFYTDRFRPGSSSLQAVQLVFDRYLLMVTVDIEVDAKKQAITSCSDPVVTLEEIVAVSGTANDQLKLKHGDSFRLSPDQWRRIVQAGGQFAAAGINVFTNMPASGIEEYKKYLNMSRDY